MAADERPPDFAAFSKLIAETRGMNSSDAGRTARHAWGFIGEGLGEEAADGLLAKCAAAGLKAVKVHSSRLELLKPPLLIKKAVFGHPEAIGLCYGTYTGIEAAMFNYTDPSGQTWSCRGADILVVAAAPVKEETVKTVKTTEGPSGQERAIRFGIMAVTGLPIGMGKSKEVKKEMRSSELSFCLDLVLRTEGLRLRLNSNNFDFSCLKEKKTYSSQTNFRVLCAELAAFAPGALKNTGLLAILENKPLAALPYDAADDFEKEVRRLAAIASN